MNNFKLVHGPFVEVFIELLTYVIFFNLCAVCACSVLLIFSLLNLEFVNYPSFYYIYN